MGRSGIHMHFRVKQIHSHVADVNQKAIFYSFLSLDQISIDEKGLSVCNILKDDRKRMFQDLF